MSDRDDAEESAPKRRKRKPMFYKTCLQKDAETEIPRSTRFRHLQDRPAASSQDQPPNLSDLANAEKSDCAACLQNVNDASHLPHTCNITCSVFDSAEDDQVETADSSESPSDIDSDNADPSDFGSSGGSSDSSSSASSTSNDSHNDEDSDHRNEDSVQSDSDQSLDTTSGDFYDCNDEEKEAQARVLKEKYQLDKKILQSNTNQISKMESLLLVLSFAMRHGLSDVAILDLLKLVNHLMGYEVIPDSMWIFNKIFSYQCGVEFHFYCSKCEAYIGKYSDFNREKKSVVSCPIRLCGQKCDVSKMNNGHFFVTIPLKSQLKCFLESMSNMSELLSYRFNIDISEDGTVRDIFDGILYKALCAEGAVLSQPYNFSLTFNTDGAPVFLSVNNSMWPILARINELPPKMRFGKDNMFISGIWFGKKSHPNMHAYFSHFAVEARELYNEGFKWKGENGEVVHSRVATLNCCLDSVAKPTVQCTKQFNSYFGCAYCVHPGDLVDLTNDVLVTQDMRGAIFEAPPENVEGGNLGNDEGQGNSDEEIVVEERAHSKKIVKQVRYAFSTGGVHPERTDAQIREDMVKSESEKKVVRGIKGISPLIVLFNFNLVWGFVIDSLHACFLGTTSHLLTLWFDSKYSSADFSIRKKIGEVDKRLLNLKVPVGVSRRPESISKRNLWKGNQLEMWTFFYCLVCLHGILPDKYFKHLTLYVTSLFTLYSDNISREEIEVAHANLLLFVEQFELYYGPSQMVYNVHLLTHLASCVKNWGPLWAYSAFHFENYNGVLKNLVKGTQGVMTQITRKYVMYRFLPKILQPYDINDAYIEICSNLLLPRRKAEAISAVKKIKLYNPNEPLTSIENDAKNAVPTAQICITEKQMCYGRMSLDSVMYYSKSYRRQKTKSCDYAVALDDGSFGVIEHIFKDRNKVFLILRCIQLDNGLAFAGSRMCKARHLKFCHLYPYGDLKVIRASKVSAKCVLLETKDRTYVALFPNVFEKD